MPTYEYLCESCGHRFEVFQHISDAPLTICPNCSGHIHRVLFPAGIVFKGAGFYKTDSRGTTTAATPAPVAHESDGATSANGATEAPAAKAETKTEAKTETTTPKAKSAPTSGASASN
ncbi:MAG TPA: FmdB family zinc ribbon protein [Ktedonobacterales bacterium]|nr:FmdB family zinc ribbon protein [Ktedonobacterales bacterium]